MISLARRTAAEGVGTAFLLAAVVGSGIMAQELSGGNVALALLANTVATVGTLGALIVAFGPVSGAHLNPAVTVADALEGGLPWREVPHYVGAQLVGALCGVALAHLMFEQAVYSTSTNARSGPAQWLSELVATFGLLSVIWSCVRHRPGAAPVAVPAFIAGAYWFTASTSFANPAVTVARALSNTFAGIRPADVPAFVAAQMAGALLATLFFRWLSPRTARSAEAVVVAHDGRKSEE